MPEYRRAYVKGGTYFFTVVTHQRLPLFRDEPATVLLMQCIETVRAEEPFAMDAYVVLPDHLHALWTLPAGDSDFSSRWRRIKARFSRSWTGVTVQDFSESLRAKGERGIWQRRFWEHAIRDQTDLRRHSDYVHYNPVKHGLVRSPSEWRHSTFSQFVEKGFYQPDWGQSPDRELSEMDLE